MPHDLFLPNREPERTIYLAFVAEARNRAGRRPAEWACAEQQAVRRAACEIAAERNLRAPTPQDVQAAEIHASGHVNYGATWAFELAQRYMQPLREESTPPRQRNV